MQQHLPTLTLKGAISMTIYSIYKITNKINNKSYIGFTSKSPTKRFREHFSSSTQVLSKAMKKYGLENFTLNIIYQSKDQKHTHSIMEPYFIHQHNTYIGEGYNMSLGGEGVGKGHVPWNKGMAGTERARLAHGQPKSVEWKVKIGASHLGKKRGPAKPFTEEHRRKISEALSGRKSPLRGRSRPQEMIEKMRVSMMKPQTKVVCPYCGKEGGVSNMKRFHFDMCKKSINN